MKNKVHNFKISDPGIILENIKKQELIAKRIEKNLKEEMKKSKHEQEINVYSGREQIRNFYQKLYKTSPENTLMCGLHTFGKEYVELMGTAFLKKIEKLRMKSGMITRHIASDARRKDMNAAVNTLSNLETREVRFIAYSSINPISTMIWNNKVWFQSFYSENAFIIEIKNKHFYETFMNHFDELWKIAKK